MPDIIEIEDSEEDDFIRIEDTDDGEEDDPIQTLIIDKAAATNREGATTTGPGEDGDDDEEGGESAAGDAAVVEDAAAAEAAAAEDGAGKKKRKKKSKKKKRTNSAAALDELAAEEQQPGGEEEATPRPSKKQKRAAPSSAPALLASGTAPVGVIIVQDGQEIARDVEVNKLIRAPRYFDEEVVHVASSRCFNCGRSGHRAGECTFAPRDKPCYLCAQFGHAAKDCPAQLCFNCGHPGHKSRECSETKGSWELGYGRCLRCSSSTCGCANKADYFRYEGGCTETYYAKDLSRCKCYVCGRYGHLCCKKTPTLPARVTCYSCGSSSHLGESCPTESRSHLAAERAGDMRRAQREREEEYERVVALAAARATQGRQNRPYSQHDIRGGGGGQYSGGGGQYGGRRSSAVGQSTQHGDRGRYGDGGQELSYPGSLDRGTGGRYKDRGTGGAATATNLPFGFVFGAGQQQYQQAAGFGQQQYRQYNAQTPGQQPAFAQQQGAAAWSTNPYASYGQQQAGRR